MRLTRVESAVAIQPTDSVLESAKSRKAAARQFGEPAIGYSDGTGGLELPATQKNYFERAGWIFVDPRDNVREVAHRQGRVRGTLVAEETYLDSDGNSVVTTPYISFGFKEGTSTRQRNQFIQNHGLTRVRTIVNQTHAFQPKVPGGTCMLDFVA